MSDRTAQKSTFGSAAYGGDNWSPRVLPHAAEIGPIWAPYGVGSEWSRLVAVLMHRPGAELGASADPDKVQMLAPLDLARAQGQHDGIAAAYRSAGVAVHYVDPPPDDPSGAPPNQMFCADLMFMTPGGVILARPASTVRAGEERHVAARLAALGVPILRTLQGTATFEGADAMWLDARTVIVGRGLRTNDEAIRQVTACLADQGVATVAVDMPFGTMHLMGMLRVADRDLAVAWPRRTPHAAVMALRERGYQVAFLPDQEEAQANRALNFVTLGPRRILMVGGNPATQRFYAELGIEVTAVPADELAKAAGAIGCLTGVLAREQV
ncbi:MAG: arginine deiminase family protein [Alphaproteobacteria bacterium]|nr:arginine deiminase family protein [Alphaproteobacteria bacterium]